MVIAFDRNTWIVDGTATQAEYQTLEKQKMPSVETNHP